MKHLASLTTVVGLTLHFSVAAVYAQQNPVNMKFSGTSAPSTVNLLQLNTSIDEDQFSGAGTLGGFTYRQIRAISNNPPTTPPPPSSCSASNQLYLTEVAGGGVFRFEDGSLMYVTLTQGADCIDLTTNEAHCILRLQIAGGTGPFKNATGTLTFTETVVTVLSDATNTPVFFAATGQFTGMLSGVEIDWGRQPERR